MKNSLSIKTEKGRKLNEIAIKFYHARIAQDEPEMQELLHKAAELVMSEYWRFAHYDSENAVPKNIEARDKFNKIPPEDLYEEYIESFLTGLQKYDPNRGTAFTTWLHGMRQQALISYMRSARKNPLINEVPFSAFDQEDGYNPIIEETISGQNVEKEVIEHLFEPERANLIKNLYQGTNDRGRLVLDELKKKPKKSSGNHDRIRSVNDVAKSLGLHNMVVDRSIKRIAGLYDPAEYGPLSDYVKPKMYWVKREYLKEYEEKTSPEISEFPKSS